MVGRGTVRLTVSIPKDIYESIKRVAASMRVSMAWVVRSALRGYAQEHQRNKRREEK
jgi:metal-responsive CopG/Arc/MetJ family transcriptional regulator